MQPTSLESLNNFHLLTLSRNKIRSLIAKRKGILDIDVADKNGKIAISRNLPITIDFGDKEVASIHD